MGDGKGRKSESPGRVRKAPRVVVAGVTVDPPGATYGPRIGKDWEFIWIQEGEASVQFDRRTFQAGPGTMLLRKSGVRDYYEWSKRRRTVHAYIHFSPGSIPRGFFPPYRILPPHDVLRPLFGYVLQADRFPEPLRRSLQSAALELMLRAYLSGRLAVQAPRAAPLPAAVERAVEMIHRKADALPPEPVRLADLAQAAHVTRESLCRQFRRVLNVGPLEYARLVRLDRAANSLRRTVRSLKDVAAETGFYDAFHLSRSFKKVYGVSPREFRASRYNEWISQRNPIIRVRTGPYHPS